MVWCMNVVLEWECFAPDLPMVVVAVVVVVQWVFLVVTTMTHGGESSKDAGRRPCR